jgi:hypothetical protein
MSVTALFLSNQIDDEHWRPSTAVPVCHVPSYGKNLQGSDWRHGYARPHGTEQSANHTRELPASSSHPLASRLNQSPTTTNCRSIANSSGGSRYHYYSIWIVLVRVAIQHRYTASARQHSRSSHTRQRTWEPIKWTRWSLGDLLSISNALFRNPCAVGRRRCAATCPTSFTIAGSQHRHTHSDTQHMPGKHHKHR